MKKLSYVLIGFALLAFLSSFTLNTPLLAQEKEEEVADVMDMALEDLLNVEITTAGKKAEKIADIPASVVVVTRAEIESYGYNTISDVLENVPGLFGIDQRGVGGMIFGVRGFWAAFANNVIILINGVRQERIESDGAVYSALYIPVEAVDRVEVIRGPMSVVYGPGAFFGVINIITNDAEKGGMVSVSYGNEDTSRLFARAAVKKEDLSLVFNAGYYRTDGIDVPHSTMSTMDLSDQTPYTSTGGLWELNNKSFTFSGSYKGFYVNLTHNQEHRGWYLLFLPTTPDGSENDRTWTSLSFGYKNDISEKFSLDTKLTYHFGSTHGDFNWFVPAGSMNIGGDNNEREQYEVDVTAVFKPSDKFSLTAGLYYKKRMIEQLQGDYPGFEVSYRIGLHNPIENRAVFAQADVAPSKAMRFIVGLRLEQTMNYDTYYRDLRAGITGGDATFEYDKVELIPRVAALFYLNEKNIIKLLYGKAINLPNFYHVVAQASSSQPPLEPEFITTLELNYLAALSEKFTLNASIFYNKFDGLIVNQPYRDPVTGAWFAGFNENAGEFKTIGAELTVKAKPSRKFTLELSGIIQKTDDERDGYEDITVANSPKFLAYLKAVYNFSKNGSLALTGRYVGDMEPLWDWTIQNADGSFGSRIAQTADGYFVIGANLRFNNLFKKGYFFSLSASNLFDTEYFFPSYSINAAWADIGLIGNGLRVMASFGKKF